MTHLPDRCAPIRGSIRLLGSDHTVQVFEVESLFAEGASMVCYQATLNGAPGLLKELCPADTDSRFYAMTRSADNQLIYAGEDIAGARESYRSTAARIERAANLLQEKRRGDSQSACDLDRYLENFVLYHGCGEDGQPLDSLYLWSYGRPITTLGKLLQELHEEPALNSAVKLYQIVDAICCLTDAIRTLHETGLIHRDIKPFNIGYTELSGGAVLSLPKLIDIDSFCAPLCDEDVIGTPSYMEPEALRADDSLIGDRYFPVVQTDIYSIGMTLAEATLLVEDKKQQKRLSFQFSNDPFTDIMPGSDALKRFRRSISRAIEDSPLFQASQANSNPLIRTRLAGILSKSLAPREFRYESCEALLHDLKALRAQLAPQGVVGHDSTLTMQRLTRHIETGRNVPLVLQYHLFDHPLFECCDGDLNIAVLGAGGYGQQFLDIALPAGQMPGRALTVTVLSDDPETKDLYLSERPSLADFYIIDDDRPGRTDCFGQINFVEERLQADSSLEQQLAERLFSGGRPVGYVMVALGQDELNIDVANACQRLARKMKLPCSVSCVLASRVRPKMLDKAVHIAHISTNPAQKRRFRDVRRAALNCHRIWSGTPFHDHDALMRDFKTPYNFNSSITAALSIRYKLKSLGLDWTGDPLDDIHLTEEEKHTFSWYEHRRWVSEKLCQGWQPLTDYAQVAQSKTSDQKNKLHVCIAHSSPGYHLPKESEFWSAKSSRSIDQAFQKGQIDDLEYVSLKVHQAVRELIQNRKLDPQPIEQQIGVIRKLLSDAPEITVLLDEMTALARRILNETDSLRSGFTQTPDCTAQFALHRDVLARLLDMRCQSGQLSRHDRNQAQYALGQINDALALPIKLLRRTNYKDNNEAIISNLPYIVNNQPEATLVVPFEPLDSQLFGNVLAATHLDPGRLIFVYRQGNVYDFDPEQLCRAFDRTMSYLTKRQLHAAVSVILLCDEGDESSMEPVAEQLKAQSQEAAPSGKEGVRSSMKPLFHQVALKSVSDSEEAVRFVEEFIRTIPAARSAVAWQLCKGNSGAIFDSRDFKKSHSCFKLDENLQLLDVHDCRWVTAYPFRESLRLLDVIALRQAKSLPYAPPAFALEYQELWALYRRSTAVWKRLCRQLAELRETQNKLVTFTRRTGNAPEKKCYFFPVEAYPAIRKILEALKEKDIVNKTSRIYMNLERCELTICDWKNTGPAFEQLMQCDPARLFNERTISLTPDWYSNLILWQDSLIFSASQTSFDRETLQLLNDISDKTGLISRPINRDGQVSFTYRTFPAKNLLTCEGRMLEVYVYHKLRASGFFDDIAGGYEIQWHSQIEAAKTSELDIIVTKGYYTLFIECKAVHDLNSEMVAKLSNDASYFEVNRSIAILVADTEEEFDDLRQQRNDVHRSQAREHRIPVIFKKAEIDRIDETIAEIVRTAYRLK